MTLTKYTLDAVRIISSKNSQFISYLSEDEKSQLGKEVEKNTQHSILLPLLNNVCILHLGEVYH